MNSKIYEICGESDLLPELENIKNDPNYVFQPDPTFTSINLFTSIIIGALFGLISIVLIIFIPEIIKFFNGFSFSKREKTF